MGVRATMLDLAILGELDQPMHGYELRQRLSTALGPVRRLSFGSLYPALHRLSDKGLIVTVDDAPKRTKKNGRAKEKTPRRQVVYKITPAGIDYLMSHLETAAVDDESLGLTMRLMSKAPAASRLAILKARRAQVLESRQANHTASQSADSWVKARAELDVQLNDNELSWLDQQIATTNDGPDEDRHPNWRNSGALRVEDTP